jgi:steroid delta-isomerase-like uncharacterized protein
MTDVSKINMEAATRFIKAFNEDDWDVVREVVSPDFVLHHPIGGDNRLGPEGMVKVWSDFKTGLPDSWHPIPVMITDGDHLANLLPTYGNFTGETHQGLTPTGKWLEYGMVNIVRLEGGKLMEAWFGMDPVMELSQMGAFPPPPQRELSFEERAHVEEFHLANAGREFDNITAFGDMVVAMGPPQYGEETTERTVEVHRIVEGRPELLYSNHFTTVPSYQGDPSADTGASRALVERFIEDVLNGHDGDAITELVTPFVLVHPTAMPCEGTYLGVAGVNHWLGAMWEAFPDIRLIEHFTMAQGDIVAVRWTAQGTSEGAFFGIPPSGGVVSYTGNTMFRVEDGRIAEIWETRNTLGIMMQLNPEMFKGHHDH